jgi:predicted lipoprotein with Yx(FWY)xxD motif
MPDRSRSVQTSRIRLGRITATLLFAAALVAACGSQAAGTSPSAGPPGTVGPGAGSGGVDEITVVQDATLGPILAGEGGKTLYVLTKDSSGVSTCSGDCATSWPPFTLDAGETAKAGAGATGTVATMTRADGATQVTYNGAPLYYYGGDTAAGTTNGQAVGGVWYTVAPAGGPNMGAPGASPSGYDRFNY